MIKEQLEKDILFQIDMQLYNEFNDKFCEINEHLGDVYTYKDLQDLENAEKEKERTLLRKAIQKKDAEINKLKQENEELQEDRDKFKKALGRKITYCNELEKDLFENSSNYVIKKQKVKDKIEELKKKVEELTDEKGYWGGSDLLEQIKVLQELLEKEQ